MATEYKVDPRAPYENIDRLVTVEMRPHNLQQGFIRPLYEIARSGDPITYDISQALLKLEGAKIAILTGIVLEKHMPKGEVDGPVGSAVLGRALSLLGHRVDIMVEEVMDDVVRSAIDTLQFDGNVVHSSNRSAQELADWAEHYDAAITIEKMGRNAKGVRHSVMGSPMPKGGDDYMDDFIDAMNAKGKLTIGIGDGGNEMGFGRIHQQTRETVRFGSDCGCPCGGGIATTTATQHLLPAAVSNYGAYAVTAALSLGAGRPDLLVDGATVRRLIEGVIALGCLDGGTVNPNFVGDDGIPIDAVMRTVDQLGSIVTQWNSTFDRNF